MNLSQQAFMADLRLRLGNPSERELENAFLDLGIRQALRDYSKVKKHNRQFLTFYLQPTIEYYTLPGNPPPAFVFDIVPAAPTTASARAFGQEFRALELDLVSFAISDLQAYQYKVSQYREMFEQIDWTYDDPPTLIITPSPVQILQAIAETGDIHTISTVPDADYETLMLAAVSFTQGMWANKRDSLAVMAAPSSVGQIELVNGDKLREFANVNRVKFEQRIGWNRPFIGQG